MYKCDKCGWYSETLQSPSIVLYATQHKGCGGDMRPVTMKR